VSRVEVALAYPPPGAGRFTDYLWPAPFTYDVNSVGVLRSDSSSAPIISPSFGGGGGALASTIVVDGGVVAVSLNTSAVVASGATVNFINKRIPVLTAKNLAGNQSVNDLCNWRLVFIVAAVAPPAAIGEMTCSLTVDPGHSSDWITTLNPGFGFQFLNRGAVNLTAINAGVLHTTPLTGAGFDATKFHGYELRMTSATATSDAQLAVLIDNVPAPVPAAFSTWGAGTNLPNTQIVAGGVGFLPVINNSSKFANSLHVHQFRSIAGPTPASLF